jgi:acetoacetyl-CoA synthetase
MMPTYQKKPVWLPEGKQQTVSGQFIEYVNKTRSLQIRSYDELHSWSIGNDTLQYFWADVYAFFDIAPKKYPLVGKALENKVFTPSDPFMTDMYR